MYLKGVKGKLWRIIRESCIDNYTSVRVNGLTEWFKANVGVKQGVILSMMLYIIFINDLIIDLSDMCLGCKIREIDCSCVAYADDIAICTLYPKSMQIMIDYAYNYSKKLCFPFNHKKCATLIYGRERNHGSFKLGSKLIDVCDQYMHLGILNKTKKTFDKKIVLSNINNMKFSFFSVLECSLSKSSLLPMSLSKVYANVSLSKIISGSEIRYIYVMLKLICMKPLIDPLLKVYSNCPQTVPIQCV